MNSLGSIRAIADDELELMRGWRNAPAVRANMYTRHEISSAEHLSWWGRVRQSDNQQYFMYEVDGNPLGIIGFVSIDTVNSSCSWAFYASPAAPKGTGSRMEYLALDYVFGSLNLNKLYCEVLAFNKPVIKLHQKFGMQIEGVFRQQHFAEGQYVDIYRLGLLREEWDIKRTEMHARLASTDIPQGNNVGS
jgi:UDP-4-amino-4,6-dideoxy-N-acetyl-beta-L-altrosamine N-acetyltransferase